MKTWMLAVLIAGCASVALAQDEAPPVYPAAVLSFEEQGRAVKEYGPRVEALLFAELADKPSIWLVERSDLEALLAETELGLSGMVRPDQAARIGQLTGARVLITGSVMEVGDRLVIVAKIIGTETSRVLGQTAKGALDDDLNALVADLAEKVADTIAEQGHVLVPPMETREDRLERLKAAVPEGERPALTVQITERHVGQATIDPAAQTEFVLLSRETGFDVLSPEKAGKSDADIVVTGEGMSEFAMRRGNLVSVQARVEVQAVDRKTGKVIAADREMTREVGLSEQIAGKAALQEAAARIAERMLPKLAAAQ